MSDPLGGVIQSTASHSMPDRFGGGQKQTTGRSFESVLQGGDSTPAVSSRPTGAGLDQLRTDFANRLNSLPLDAAKMDEMFPEFFNTRTRLGLLREAVQGVPNSPRGIDLRGRFGQLENEWYQVEQIMKSDRDLSNGELIGLQARLYQVSQHVEVMSKVVDQMTSGIKTILNTNV